MLLALTTTSQTFTLESGMAIIFSLKEMMYLVTAAKC